MNTVRPSTEGPETVPLKLLTDLQSEVATALNSLGGQLSRSISDHYYVYAAGHINSAAEGYLLLRTAGRADASKLLVRPAIEAMIRIQAFRHRPELLYQIAFTEALEDKKWFRPAAAKQGMAYDDQADPRGWDEFEAEYTRAFPNTPPKKHKLTLDDASKVAGLKSYYDTHYRMYCKYAHAALRAIGGF